MWFSFALYSFTNIYILIKQGIIKSQSSAKGTITYWNPNQSGKPKVVISSDNQKRVVTAIKNKPNR